MLPVRFLDKKVDQLGFVVEDVDKTVKSYYALFGIGDWKIYTYGKPLLSFMNYRGKPVDYKARIALSYLGETRIELIQNLEGKTVYTEFIDKHGYGLQHLGIYVADIETALREARSAGVSCLWREAALAWTATVISRIWTRRSVRNHV